MNDKAIIISCTHKAQGNSNTAAHLLASGIQEAGGEAEVIYLRKLKVLPCTACGICCKDPEGKCVLQHKDYAQELHEILLDAPLAFFTAPIYFYHLPSILKTWIDRSQQVYCMKKNGHPRIKDLPVRPAYACLVAGRPRGEKLFEGSLLTLKYFLDSYKLKLAESLTFRGIDHIGALEEHPRAVSRIRAMGRKAWEAHAARCGR